MSDQDYSYEPKGISKGSGSTTDPDNWVPIPEGRYQFQIENVKVKPPKEEFTVVDGKQRKNNPLVVYHLVLTGDDENKLKAKVKGKLPEGKEQSTSAWATFGYTFGWYDRDDVFRTTKLFQFMADCAGFGPKADLKRWLLAGGVVDPKFLQGTIFRGFVEHQPRKDGKGVWVNVTPMALEDHEDENRKRFNDWFEMTDPTLYAKLIADAGDEDEDQDDVAELAVAGQPAALF